MKVATLTLHNANNYGAVLQAYALQSHIKGLGCDTELINYFPNQHITRVSRFSRYNPKKIINFLRRRINQSKKVAVKFKSFRKNYLSVSKETYYGDVDVHKSTPRYDAYIVGSDQIWNTQITNNSKAFFLHFVDAGLKIAYAASFGSEMVAAETKENIQKFVKDFNHISVRECSAVDILMSELDIDTHVVLDPVFLLDKKKWEGLSEKTRIPSDYIFVYLMEPSVTINRIAYSLEKQTGLNIAFISASSQHSNIKGKRLKGLGPREFLYAIANAQYVITNSFHGLAFSIIFEKDLFAVKHSKRNTRLANILEMVRCDDKMADDKSVINLKKLCINGRTAKQCLYVPIEKSKKFISNSLNL